MQGTVQIEGGVSDQLIRHGSGRRGADEKTAISRGHWEMTVNKVVVMRGL